MKQRFVFLCCLLAMACSNNSDETESGKKDPEMSENISQDTTPLLNDILLARKKAWEAKADSAKKAAYAQGIIDIFEAGTTESALNIGSEAPEFELQNALGENISLKEYLKKGPVILTWYRGGWCPYCNITLNRMQQELPKFKALGANLIALTPEIPDSSLSTKEKNQLEFEVLSDVGNDVARQYGIVYELNPQVAEYYESGPGLSNYLGDASTELPLAATFIVDQQGKIQYAFLHNDYRVRAEPKDIIAALKRIKG